MVDDRYVEGARIFHRAAHDGTVRDRFSVIRNRTAGPAQVADFRRVPLPSDRLVIAPIG